MADSKKLIVPIGIVLLAGVGVGGYFWNEQRICHGLEEDYLNAIAEIRGQVAVQSIIAPSAELEEARNDLEKIQWRIVERSYEGLLENCGERDAKTAARKGQDLLLGV